MTALTTVKTPNTEIDSDKDMADNSRLTPAAVRAKAKLGKAEMAALLGMSEFGYNQWEVGTRRAGGPAYRLLHLIARDGVPIIEALRDMQD